MPRAIRSRSAIAASSRAAWSAAASARSPSWTTYPPTPPAMSTSTMLLNVVCGSAWRSTTSAAMITAAPASPPAGPPATAQARTDEAAQDVGMVGAPALIWLAGTISRVLSTRAAADRDVGADQPGCRPRGRA